MAPDEMEKLLGMMTELHERISRRVTKLERQVDFLLLLLQDDGK